MLDVNQLPEKSCLRPGCTSSCQWINGNEVFSIRLRAEAERLHRRYTVRGKTWPRPSASSICAAGSAVVAFFFICPGDGSDCKRRVTKLHLSHRYFLCRHCNKLAYASQYEQPWRRALRRANKLKQRLGIGVGIGEPFPHKPRGMWTRTYGSLLNEILHAEILANEAQANRFKRLLAQPEGDLE
jgi:hypothetical protein